MDAITVLENRITAMECKVFGRRNPHSFDFNTSTSAAEALTYVHTLLAAALRGRETISSTLTRLPELNECLDPNYEDNFLSVDAKLQYVLAMEPEVRATAEALTAMAKLSPCLDSDAIKNVAKHTTKLEALSAAHLDMKTESDDVAESIRDAMQKYNEIINIISRNLSQMDSTITEIEISRLPKERLD